MRYKIAVIGTINRDSIHLPDGGVFKDFGGILYNLYPLSCLFGPEAGIYPVCNLGHDIYEEVIRRLKKLKNLHPEGVKKVKRKNNHAILFCSAGGDRIEFLKGGVPPLSFEDCKFVLDSDFLLVNFISGFDLSLSTLQKIFSKRGGKLLLDFHSLSLGIGKEGKRFHRAPRGWEGYVRSCDYLQLNRQELEVLGGGRNLSLTELATRMRRLHRLGPEGVLVTLGEKGALASLRRGDKITKERFNPCGPAAVIDSTGCGDVFTAGFVSSYLRGRDFFKAAAVGNEVAGFKAGFSGVEGLRNLSPGRSLPDPE